MTTDRLPKQLEASCDLIRSWSIDYPRFYGVKATDRFVDELFETESRLAAGAVEGLNPQICRVLASYHGPKGAKVPLSISTISGCVRPAFIMNNDWLQPGAMACYSSGCYLFHARAVPAKQVHEYKVRAHLTPKDGLLAAARLSRYYGVPIRDNQSSDGSLSIALPLLGGNEPQLLRNLRVLQEHGYTDTSYLCFSSAYTKVPGQMLRALEGFNNLVVHLTTSGWHSKSENLLRLNEFERYKSSVNNVMLRVVNRQDWSSNITDVNTENSAACCEEWLLTEIERRKLTPFVIRTPFHSVHPFPGSRTGSLGSRHMAFTEYNDEIWGAILERATGECCTTGKCKTCPTRCGTSSNQGIKARNLMISARALECMYWFEVGRQSKEGVTPLGLYTARILARKSMEQYSELGISIHAEHMKSEYSVLSQKCANADLTKLQRRRLVNDSHALVVDGLDRHRLWNCAKQEIHS